MAQSVDAIYFHGPQVQMDHTPGADVAAGTMLFFPAANPDALVAVANVALEANKLGAVDTDGIYKVKKKSGAVFSKGEVVGWDTGNSEAVVDGDAAQDLTIGVCYGDAASGDDFVLTRINMARGAEGSS